MNDDVISLNEIGKIRTVKVYNQAYVDKQQKRIEELEKENAELKEKYNKVDIIGYDALKNLTKAKVALRNVIDYLGQFCSDYPDCVIEAEKILKEIEK